jgi:hypothetical protein
VGRDRDSKSAGASITIDRDLSGLSELRLDGVPDVVATLALSDSDRRHVLDLARQLDTEMRGARDQARVGSIIEAFRRISREAYEAVGKPMYVTLVSSRGDEQS